MTTTIKQCHQEEKKAEATQAFFSASQKGKVNLQDVLRAVCYANYQKWSQSTSEAFKKYLKSEKGKAQSMELVGITQDDEEIDRQAEEFEKEVDFSDT